MTTRIINGVKFECEVTERTEKELLEIAAQDESFDMEDFETPEVKIAVGDVFDEFLNHEVFELDEIHEAIARYFEEVAETLDEDATSVMYVIGDANDKIYTSFEAPDVLTSLKFRDITDERLLDLQSQLVGYSWPTREDIADAVFMAIGETDPEDGDINFIDSSDSVQVYCEDGASNNNAFDIELSETEDGEIRVDSVELF